MNTDAGTMSPFEHGEVFVLDDGGEVHNLFLKFNNPSMVIIHFDFEGMLKKKRKKREKKETCCFKENEREKLGANFRQFLFFSEKGQ